MNYCLNILASYKEVSILVKRNICIFSALNEGDVHDNGIEDEVTDKEQRMKISNATLPYLEQLHKLLLHPPYVSIICRAQRIEVINKMFL